MLHKARRQDFPLHFGALFNKPAIAWRKALRFTAGDGQLYFAFQHGGVFGKRIGHGKAPLSGRKQSAGKGILRLAVDHRPGHLRVAGGRRRAEQADAADWLQVGHRVFKFKSVHSVLLVNSGLSRNRRFDASIFRR